MKKGKLLPAERNAIREQCRAERARLRAWVPAERARVKGQIETLRANLKLAIAKLRAQLARDIADARKRGKVRACVQAKTPVKKPVATKTSRAKKHAPTPMHPKKRKAAKPVARIAPAYSITGGWSTFATLEAAKRAAQESANHLGQQIAVSRDGERVALISPELSLAGFAKLVKAAARSRAVAKFHSDRAYIGSLWEHRGGALAGLDLPHFKARLIEAHRAGLLRLTRADLVGAMPPEEVERSEMSYMGATFHFVALD